MQIKRSELLARNIFLASWTTLVECCFSFWRVSTGHCTFLYKDVKRSLTSFKYVTMKAVTGDNKSLVVLPCRQTSRSNRVVDTRMRRVNEVAAEHCKCKKKEKPIFIVATSIKDKCMCDSFAKSWPHDSIFIRRCFMQIIEYNNETLKLNYIQKRSLN